MNTRRSLTVLTGLVGLMLAFPFAPARGHSHIEIIYRDNQLRLVYYDFDSGESDPSEVLLEVGLPAARPVPNLPSYTRLLGEAGATTWILPESSQGDLLWLGIGNGGLRATDFVGPASMSLLSVEGPGHFALFQSDSFGQPIVLMNSRDEVGPQDTMNVPLGSHIHCQWAFSAPGRYRVRLIATATLRAGNTPITSAPTDYHFEVIPPPPAVLGLVRTPTNALHLLLHGHPGLNYQIETADTFPRWNAWIHLPARHSVTTSSIPVLPASNRFFRARLR